MPMARVLIDDPGILLYHSHWPLVLSPELHIYTETKKESMLLDPLWNIVPGIS